MRQSLKGRALRHFTLRSNMTLIVLLGSLLVRWIEGVLLRRQRKCKTIEEFAPPRKILESTTATFLPFFVLFPARESGSKKGSLLPSQCLLTLYVVVGIPTFMPPWSKSQACAEAKQKLARRTFSSLPCPLPWPRERLHPFPSVALLVSQG
uniref:Uncharacterized protein n=1 Tax=Ananas comosus var. bracteatus TaxID=296719 RepID=A0A6V7PYQ7_ANACO|nr:unnamed protein product [Ananas comosus var. bracteatus]